MALSHYSPLVTATHLRLLQPPQTPYLYAQQRTPAPLHRERSARLRTAASSTKQNSSVSVLTAEQGRIASDKATTDDLPKRWREIHGSGNWNGLLDPVDPLLRSELIRYGEFSQACYDAFDFDPYSRNCGACKYSRRHFFTSLGMQNAGYEVTRYIYATETLNLPNSFTRSLKENKWSDRANWIGYIAVSTDEGSARLGRRDILVAWRGTITKLEWIADLMNYLRPVAEEGIPCSDAGVKAEAGFLELYNGKESSCRFCKFSAREQVLAEVKKQLEAYTKKGEEVSISITGHSLGSALATLNAYDLAETGVVGGTPVCVFSFSGPRVGNGKWKQRLESFPNVKVLRVVNVHDKVPKVPGLLFNERFRWPKLLQKLSEQLPWTYSHVGVELTLNHQDSPFLKDTPDISCYHNLEAHLHLLDGFHGIGRRFAPATGRDPALVNKSCDFLEAQHLVPPYWRQDENKGLVKADDGRWTLPEKEKSEHEHLQEDIHEDTHHHLSLLGLPRDQL